MPNRIEVSLTDSTALHIKAASERPQIFRDIKRIDSHEIVRAAANGRTEPTLNVLFRTSHDAFLVGSLVNPNLGAPSGDPGRPDPIDKKGMNPGRQCNLIEEGQELTATNEVDLIVPTRADGSLFIESPSADKSDAIRIFVPKGSVLGLYADGSLQIPVGSKMQIHGKTDSFEILRPIDKGDQSDWRTVAVSEHDSFVMHNAVFATLDQSALRQAGNLSATRLARMREYDIRPTVVFTHQFSAEVRRAVDKLGELMKNKGTVDDDMFNRIERAEELKAVRAELNSVIKRFGRYPDQMVHDIIRPCVENPEQFLREIDERIAQDELELERDSLARETVGATPGRTTPGQRRVQSALRTFDIDLKDKLKADADLRKAIARADAFAAEAGELGPRLQEARQAIESVEDIEARIGQLDAEIDRLEGRREDLASIDEDDVTRALNEVRSGHEGPDAQRAGAVIKVWNTGQKYRERGDAFLPQFLQAQRELIALDQPELIQSLESLRAQREQYGARLTGVAEATEVARRVESERVVVDGGFRTARHEIGELGEVAQRAEVNLRNSMIEQRSVIEREKLLHERYESLKREPEALTKQQIDNLLPVYERYEGLKGDLELAKRDLELANEAIVQDSQNAAKAFELKRAQLVVARLSNTLEALKEGVEYDPQFENRHIEDVYAQLQELEVADSCSPGSKAIVTKSQFDELKRLNESVREAYDNFRRDQNNPEVIAQVQTAELRRLKFLNPGNATIVEDLNYATMALDRERHLRRLRAAAPGAGELSPLSAPPVDSAAGATDLNFAADVPVPFSGAAAAAVGDSQGTNVEDAPPVHVPAGH
jgi:uncharacterized small protein (DUF1192 family)